MIKDEYIQTGTVPGGGDMHGQLLYNLESVPAQ